MEIKELGHLVLYVRDLDAVARVLPRRARLARGRPRGARHAGGRVLSGRTHHELLLIEVGPDATAIPAGRRVGLYHFGLKVGDSDDELREALTRLNEAGVTVVGASDHTVTHSLYILDPDGNEIELYVDTGVDWASNPELIMAPIRPLQL